MASRTPAAEGFLRDFGEVDAVLKAIRENLDHHLLNEEVEGLGTPTLENIARYIFDACAGEAAGSGAR